jgi:hypothetical protein
VGLGSCEEGGSSRTGGFASRTGGATTATGSATTSGFGAAATGGGADGASGWAMTGAGVRVDHRTAATPAAINNPAAAARIGQRFRPVVADAADDADRLGGAVLSSSAACINTDAGS